MKTEDAINRAIVEIQGVLAIGLLPDERGAFRKQLLAMYKRGARDERKLIVDTIVHLADHDAAAKRLGDEQARGACAALIVLGARIKRRDYVG